MRLKAVSQENIKLEKLLGGKELELTSLIDRFYKAFMSNGVKIEEFSA